MIRIFLINKKKDLCYDHTNEINFSTSKIDEYV